MKDRIQREADIHRLATKVVDNMDLDALMNYVYEDLVTLYSYNSDVFEDTWEQYFEGNNDD